MLVSKQKIEIDTVLVLRNLENKVHNLEISVQITRTCWQTNLMSKDDPELIKAQQIIEQLVFEPFIGFSTSTSQASGSK